ncbi:MAG: thermonuclease family protein [Nitrospirae bacterium]|nr:thermonuclease family protein [Nitrospirota bacterium]
MDQKTGGLQEKAGLRRLLRSWGWSVPLVLLGAVLFLSGAFSESKAQPRADAQTVEHGKPVAVKRVIDGDTIELVNGETVRYLGIDAPEMRRKVNGRWVESVEPFAPEAYELNRRLVEGQRVRLELDREVRDRYHRLLAYVFVNDRLVNAELISSGYVVVRLHPPNLRYADLFMKLQTEALARHRGLWASEGQGLTR